MYAMVDPAIRTRSARDLSLDSTEEEGSDGDEGEDTSHCGSMSFG